MKTAVAVRQTYAYNFPLREPGSSAFLCPVGAEGRTPPQKGFLLASSLPTGASSHLQRVLL